MGELEDEDELEDEVKLEALEGCKDDAGKTNDFLPNESVETDEVS
jgi:hypothetical protein